MTHFFYITLLKNYILEIFLLEPQPKNFDLRMTIVCVHLQYVKWYPTKNVCSWLKSLKCDFYYATATRGIFPLAYPRSTY